MIFRRAFFFIATFERLSRLVPKIIKLFFNFILCSWVLYLINFGAIEFSNSGLLYRPIDSIVYMFSYLKHIVKFRHDLSLSYFIYFGLSIFLSYFLINGIKNLIFILKSAFLGDTSFGANNLKKALRKKNPKVATDRLKMKAKSEKSFVKKHSSQTNDDNSVNNNFATQDNEKNAELYRSLNKESEANEELNIKSQNGDK